MPFSVLIVEDSLSYSLELEQICRQLGYSVAGVVTNSADALDHIFSQPPDLILMDINIKGRLSGTEVGAKIRHLQVPILFLTSYADATLRQQAANCDAIGYITKPIDIVSLETVLKMAKVKAYFHGREEPIIAPSGKAAKQYVYLKKDRTYQKAHLMDIVAVSAEGNYCKVHMVDGEIYLLRSTLVNLRKQLPADGLLQVHRSHLVRASQVESVDFSKSLLRVGTVSIPISRGKVNMLRERLPFIN